MSGEHCISVAMAGEHAIAGPLVVAALVLDARMPQPRFTWVGIRGRPYLLFSDFDVAPSAIRQQMTRWLYRNCLGCSLVVATVTELNRGTSDVVTDTLLGRATYRAVEHAINRTPSFCMAAPTTQILVPGRAPLPSKYVGRARQRMYPGRDKLPWQIDAAYAYARTRRDQLMAELSTDLPAYGFSTNNGYATREHCRAVYEHGRSPHHRIDTPATQTGAPDA